MSVSVQKVVDQLKLIRLAPKLGCAGLIASNIVVPLLILGAIIEGRGASILDLQVHQVSVLEPVPACDVHGGYWL